MLALVWIAGPLSGVLVQPYVGLKSDNCRITWGKRRPFIIGGALATIASLMLLGWAREIVALFGKLFGADGENEWVVTITMVFAVLLVYVLDFAINVIQAAIRAYIVDVAPTHQQESANAWLMRSAGVGNIAGYLAGYINLPFYLPWLGDTQFKVLCAIASIIMALTVGISCTAGERDPTRDPPPAEQKEGVMAFFSGLNRSAGSPSFSTSPLTLARSTPIHSLRRTRTCLTRKSTRSGRTRQESAPVPFWCLLAQPSCARSSSPSSSHPPFRPQSQSRSRLHLALPSGLLHPLLPRLPIPWVVLVTSR
jgi:MFS family permease